MKTFVHKPVSIYLTWTSFSWKTFLCFNFVLQDIQIKNGFREQVRWMEQNPLFDSIPPRWFWITWWHCAMREHIMDWKPIFEILLIGNLLEVNRSVYWHISQFIVFYLIIGQTLINWLVYRNMEDILNNVENAYVYAKVKKHKKFHVYFFVGILQTGLNPINDGMNPLSILYKWNVSTLVSLGYCNSCMVCTECHRAYNIP